MSSGGVSAGGKGGAASGMGGASVAGAAGVAGAGGMGGTSGATGGAGGSSSTDDPCAGGMELPASDKGSKAPARGYGGVQFTVSTQTEITALETTLTVPAKPPTGGTLFLWPGLEPLQNSRNYSPIGTGVLQPVLTWGLTCAPNAPNNYSSWWISGQYVNTLANSPGHTGCNGGQGMAVAVGDDLHILMSLKGKVWSQVITDLANGKSVSYDIDMAGQAQNWVIYSIEGPNGKKPVSDVIFKSNVITVAAADSKFCTPSVRGTNDFFSAPKASTDGTKCCVSKIILRAQGVAATDPNQ